MLLVKRFRGKGKTAKRKGKGVKGCQNRIIISRRRTGRGWDQKGISLGRTEKPTKQEDKTHKTGVGGMCG